MDKEQAKFVLQSFRPDGADAKDLSFANALKLATEDRELGEWLADRRAEDAEFAAALSSIQIPNTLRGEILDILKFDGNRHEDADDAIFIGALASVPVPENLREQIYSALEVELAGGQKRSKIIPFPFFSLLGGVAAAAALGFSAYLVFSPQEEASQIAGVDSPGGTNYVERVELSQAIVPVALNSMSAQMEMGMSLKTSIKNIDFGYTPQPGEGIEQVNSWLSGQHHPVPSSLPNGLENAPILGSKQVILTTGHKASLVSFHKENMGEMHMVILDLESVEDLKNFETMDKVGLKSCKTCPVSEFLITRWRDSSNAYMLLSHAKPLEIKTIF